jgi:hypothetical protein
MTGLQKALVLLAVAVFCWRALEIGAAFNHTFDEPTQIASGLELWQYGIFTLHSDVPPLAKLLISAPAYVSGVRLAAPLQRGDWAGANGVLYDSDRYWFVLRSARAVNTAIGVGLVIALTLFAARTFGGVAAVAASWCAACSPGLVSAASIANSDILGVVTVLAGFTAFRRLLVTGALRDAAWFSLAFALALATKLSAVPFFAFGLPLIAVYTLGRQLPASLRRPLTVVRTVAPMALLFAIIVPMVIWSIYGFHLAAPLGPEEAVKLSTALGPRHPVLAADVSALPDTPLPLGGFLRGVGVGYNISHLGHPAYLMGHYSLHGWPYYFAITLLLKVPIGTWIAVLAALAVAVRYRNDPRAQEVLLLLALCAAVLLSVAGGGINAGHRHVVIVEALFALAAAGGVALAALHRGSVVMLVIAGALSLGSVASLRAGVDALGYTNALAGTDPDWWFIDSNLDWGQDLERLHHELEARQVSGPIELAYFGTAEPQRHGIDFRPLPPGQRACGWIAVSVNSYRGLSDAGIGRLPSEESRAGYTWLADQVPVTRIGTSMRLYDITNLEGGCPTADGTRGATAAAPPQLPPPLPPALPR